MPISSDIDWRWKVVTPELLGIFYYYASHLLVESGSSRSRSPIHPPALLRLFQQERDDELLAQKSWSQARESPCIDLGRHGANPAARHWPRCGWHRAGAGERVHASWIQLAHLALQRGYNAGPLWGKAGGLNKLGGRSSYAEKRS